MDQSKRENRQTSSYENQTPYQGENIKVAVRLRPFTPREIERGSNRIIEMEKNTVLILNPKNETDHFERKFTFDYGYWSHDGFKKDDNGLYVGDPLHINGSKYATQEKVFSELGEFLLDNAFEGYNSALLAYGQTGSGKSYSISGYGNNKGILPRFAESLFKNLNAKTNASQMESILKKTGADSQLEPMFSSYEIYFSMIEIYNEVVRDLLASSQSMLNRALKVREHPKQGFFVENLTSHLCKNHNDIASRIEDGQMNKSIAATNMNETSSRGHTIYEFTIKLARSRENSSSGENSIISSVVQIVDLAGSERIAVVSEVMDGRKRTRSPGIQTNKTNTAWKSNDDVNRHGRNKNTTSASSSILSHSQQLPSSNFSSSRSKQHHHQSTSHNQSNNNGSNNRQSNQHAQRFKESISINQSLSTLGNCIQILSQYSQQIDASSLKKFNKLKIPYRDSVLTKLLNKCCLSGNSKVVIMATLSPSDMHYDETLSTLRFADRAKQIKTHATINSTIDRSLKDFERLEQENERLKKIVQNRNVQVNKSDDSSQTSNFDDSENLAENFSGSDIGTSQEPQYTKVNHSNKRLHSRKTRQLVGKSKLVSNNNEQLNRLVNQDRSKLKTISQERDEKGSSEDRVSSDHEFYNEDDDNNNDSDIEIFDNDNEFDDPQNASKTVTSIDSDDSLAILDTDEVSEKEKIEILNKLLSNAKITEKLNINRRTQGKSQKNRINSRPTITKRPKGTRRLSVITGSLKSSNPYLSNLNQDEQLTGKITYILKYGETIIGREDDCDIILHGLEIRTHHAKIIRISSEHSPPSPASTKRNSTALGANKANYTRSSVTIEPIFNVGENSSTNSALMVNGFLIDKKTQLNHCDRILIGTNSYFVYIDFAANILQTSSTIANPDMVTFEMARGEAVKNLVSQQSNGKLMQEINDYNHRPGTGKYHANIKRNDSNVNRILDNSKVASSNSQEEPKKDLDVITKNNSNATNKQTESDANAYMKSSNESLDAMYKDILIEDTYDLTIPVAEANAVAREMGIKVEYSLKILTGEERLIGDNFSSNYATDLESNVSEPTSSVSTHRDDRREHIDEKLEISNELQVDRDRLYAKSLSSLDVPPELYIKVYCEESDFEFYWTKDKFHTRRYKMLELYGVWDNGGKSGLIEYLIDQSKVLGKYLDDPFVDNPAQTFILIGHSQIVLQPILHMTDITQNFDILDLNDQVIGSIQIQATPCKRIEEKRGFTTYVALNEKELTESFVEDPTFFLDKNLAFEFKIISCQDLPDKYFNIYCQYALERDASFVRTNIVRLMSDVHNEDIQESANHLVKLNFEHKHYIVFDSVTEEILNFLQHGFITIQVVGQYIHQSNKSLTVISTIIKSIEKYTINQDSQGYGSEYQSNSIKPADTNLSQTSSVGSTNTSANHNGNHNSYDDMLLDEADEVEEDEEDTNLTGKMNQESIIDMILTKRKLDRAEHQLQFLKRTVNIAEHNNKKHIPIRTVKRLLSSYGQVQDNGSFEEATVDTTAKETPAVKHSNCMIQ